MPKFSANLTMMFTEVDFVDRFARAAAHDFTTVEYMFPYDWPAPQLKEMLQQHQLEQVLFNLPVDEWASGVRGIACIPGREQQFQENVGRAIDEGYTLLALGLDNVFLAEGARACLKAAGRATE